MPGVTYTACGRVAATFGPWCTDANAGVAIPTRSRGGDTTPKALEAMRRILARSRARRFVGPGVVATSGDVTATDGRRLAGPGWAVE